MTPRSALLVLLLLPALPGCGERRVGGSGRLEALPGTARRLAVAGRPYELGFWQGRLLADRIAALDARWQAAAFQGSEGPARRDACLVYADQARRLLPEAARQELEGLADGSGTTVEARLLTELLLDGLRFHESAPRLEGLLACAGEPLEARGVPSGPDADLLRSEVLLVERRPEGGRATLLVAWPGSLGGLAGASETGLALLAFPAPAPAEQQGLAGAPFSLLLRRALEEADDAEGLLARLTDVTAWRVLALDGPAGRRLLGSASLASALTADLATSPCFALPPQPLPDYVPLPTPVDPAPRRAFDAAREGGWRVTWGASGWRVALGPGEGGLLPLAPPP